MIYLIGEQPELGPVKIGYSADPELRLAILRAPSDPTKAPSQVRRKGLALLDSMEGGYRTEAALHDALSPVRLVGEWFDLGPDLLGCRRAFRAAMQQVQATGHPPRSRPARASRRSTLPFGGVLRQHRIDRRGCACGAHDARLCMAYHRCCSRCVISK